MFVYVCVCVCVYRGVTLYLILDRSKVLLKVLGLGFG